MKTSTAIAIGSAALGASVLATAPAQASPYSLDTMSSNMMSAAQASSLGVAGNHIRDFQYLEGTKESPDDFWLCDLAGDKQVEVDGPPEVYVVSYASDKSRVATAAGQELYAFANVDDAREAMKAIRKASAKCSGTFTEQGERWTIRHTLSHGTGMTAGGQGFTWIKQGAQAVDAPKGPDAHEYVTFRRAGQFVQVISLELAGPQAPKLTSSQVKQVDTLTGTLGDYWAW